MCGYRARFVGVGFNTLYLKMSALVVDILGVLTNT